MRRTREGGEEGLVDRLRPGRESKLTKRQEAALRRRLLKGARTNGFDTERWTCLQFRELIRRTYGVECRVESLRYRLKSLGFTCQKPQLRAAERDEKAMQTWSPATGRGFLPPYARDLNRNEYAWADVKRHLLPHCWPDSLHQLHVETWFRTLRLSVREELLKSFSQATRVPFHWPP